MTAQAAASFDYVQISTNVKGGKSYRLFNVQQKKKNSIQTNQLSKQTQQHGEQTSEYSARDGDCV